MVKSHGFSYPLTQVRIPPRPPISFPRKIGIPMHRQTCIAVSSHPLTLWRLRKRCNPPIRRSCGKKSSIIQAQTRPCEGKNNLQRHLWMSCGIISIREDAEGRNAVPSSLPLPVCLCFCSESLVRFDVSRLTQPLVA